MIDGKLERNQLLVREAVLLGKLYELDLRRSGTGDSDTIALLVKEADSLCQDLSRVKVSLLNPDLYL